MPAKRKTTNKKPFHQTPELLLVLGVLFLAISFGYQTYSAYKYSFDAPPPTIKASTSAAPTNIKIASRNINLPIFEAIIQKNVWQVQDEGISHLTTSANPTDQGPIILYGHNTINRFGPIRWMELNEEIEITTTDNQTYKYQVSEIHIVKPSDIHILLSDTETLILYTCTGLFDSQRFVIRATPI